MEEAAAVGNLQAVEGILPSLLISYDLTVPLHERAAPGASYILDRSIRAAAAHGWTDVTRFFISQGAVIDDALVCAVINSGSIEQCELLLRHGWDVNCSYISASGDWHFWTPLRASLGDLQLCRWLLEHGADPNLSEYGFTPIMVAVRYHSPKVVKLLVEHGADPKTPMLLHSTASASKKAIHEAYPNREDPDRIGVMKLLLDNGADVNEMEPDPKSRPRDDARRRRAPDTGTPLHYAVAAGNAVTVSFLLAHGANTKLPSWSGHTPLQTAEILEMRYIKQILRLYG
ncbi:putative ankyrin repeat protein [Rosellinia necatrix]|uniref:Putative ankyrin repeat protein n=1 Tax=Rosellinia necatrix TaxID=77044 RepID=A0A1W2TDF0_ROSNE|nr:putative ankyrin repeat protein [Rosellinia necatrix]